MLYFPPLLEAGSYNKKIKKLTRRDSSHADKSAEGEPEKKISADILLAWTHDCLAFISYSNVYLVLTQ